ncbi:hypothetical protein JTE90_020944 [Oedothorax gibbosus]|uniref:Uncharacterized protein n=1 Tax=Oedothorax gibbosus TaxID=931172 RepID=A0AAV6VQT8_9ARAC|nr:hypothetical protein JTE90_020944 [Oedothorax gibbosus]
MSVTLRPTQAIDHDDVTGGHAPPVGPINLPRTPSQHEGSFEREHELGVFARERFRSHALTSAQFFEGSSRMVECGGGFVPRGP